MSETGTVSSTAANDDSVVTLHLHRTHHKSSIPAIEECNLAVMNLEDKIEEMEKANQKAIGIIIHTHWYIPCYKKVRCGVHALYIIIFLLDEGDVDCEACAVNMTSEPENCHHYMLCLATKRRLAAAKNTKGNILA